MRSGKLWKLISITWLIGIPRYCLTVWIVSAAPPIAYAALILSRPWPGMSTTVSRGIESLADLPPPERMSRIESERLGPEVDAPGSLEPEGRWSEPRTSVVVAERRPGPPASSAVSASLLALLCWTTELTRKSTTERATHPTSARTSHLTTRP